MDVGKAGRYMKYGTCIAALSVTRILMNGFEVFNKELGAMFERVCYLQAMLFNEWRMLSNESRDLPIEWNIMHMYTSSQLAKLLALKRSIDPEKAALVATLHDIAVVATGKHERHGELAEPYIREAVSKHNNNVDLKLTINKEDVDLFVEAIKVHSNKKDISENGLIELLKDVDCLDRYLNGVDTYGIHMDRCQKALKELGCVF